ncbi:hypothetical protein MNBD_GAMMA05-1123 [hydrothermal vent metagenome]|uniref:DUF374 domain-containing protein n=1 Tax=hydrothermal vent metagenome TaxID=652676 RepID=A0A3B0WKY4_9ZZZZ
MTANPYGKKMPETPIDKTSGEVPDSKVAKGKKNPRQMTAKRKISYLLLKPIILIIVNFIWLTCRIKVIGQENMDAVVNEQKPVIPCYWHQQHLFCAWYMLKQIKCGMNVGFLVSPSVDGEIPAQIASSRGAKVIRGSSTRTGAQALRDMYQIIVKDGVSPVTTSDGPTGPIFKFKPGAAMLSQMTKAPMVPIACAAKNAWYLGSWDRFMVPKPFTKIVVAVGEPISVDKAEKDLSPVQEKMEYAINDLMKNAKQAM